VQPEGSVSVRGRGAVRARTPRPRGRGRGGSPMKPITLRPVRSSTSLRICVSITRRQRRRKSRTALPPPVSASVCSPRVRVSCSTTKTAFSLSVVLAFVGPRPVARASSLTIEFEIAAASSPPCGLRALIILLRAFVSAHRLRRHRDCEHDEGHASWELRAQRYSPPMLDTSRGRVYLVPGPAHTGASIGVPSGSELALRLASSAHARKPPTARKR